MLFHAVALHLVSPGAVVCSPIGIHVCPPHGVPYTCWLALGALTLILR